MTTRKTSQNRLKTPLFDLGRVVVTPGALAALADANETPLKYIARHVRGDWGDLADEDQRENKFSLEHNLRLLSAYHTSTGCKVWVITEADRSVTTLLLPSEY